MPDPTLNSGPTLAEFERSRGRTLVRPGGAAGGTRLTYRQMRGEANRFARFMKSQAGRRVGRLAARARHDGFRNVGQPENKR